MLITELTVLPSNLHWYLKTFKLKATRLFHFNQGLRLWSFIILRLPVPAFVLYKLFSQFDKFQEQVALARYTVVVSVICLSLMNIYWTYQMMILYLGRTTLKQERANSGKPPVRAQKHPTKKSNKNN